MEGTGVSSSSPRQRKGMFPCLTGISASWVMCCVAHAPPSSWPFSFAKFLYLANLCPAEGSDTSNFEAATCACPTACDLAFWFWGYHHWVLPPWHHLANLLNNTHYGIRLSPIATEVIIWCFDYFLWVLKNKLGFVLHASLKDFKSLIAKINLLSLASLFPQPTDHDCAGHLSHFLSNTIQCTYLDKRA